MRKIARASLCVGCMLLLPSAGSVSRAEDVEKRFRIGLAVGGYNTQDKVRSDAANVLFIVDQSDEVQLIYEDPRNDNAAIGNLTIEPAFRAAATVQYAFNKVFVLEGSVGYQKGDVGEIELQAQFFGEDIPSIERFRFRVYRIAAGELTQVPLELTALARFRPRASLNPYMGIGAGYTFIGFDPSPQLDVLSRNMDAAQARFARLDPFPGGLSDAGETLDLSGATVDARDTFEWHLAGGIEYTFKKKWSAFLDVRYHFASRSFDIGFNGSEQLGVSVPEGTEDFGPAFTLVNFGAYSISDGGLWDGGRLVPEEGAPAGTDCTQGFANCVFTPEPDGVLDPGRYYVRGGNIKYGGPSLKVGVRYTF